ncbi:MAG: hypothetical protein LBD91_05815 [Prevotellaceae bacterium]|jgi:hypothetical protein|nr:hypothetical protein [Prevotellaceae bacterium]
MTGGTGFTMYTNNNWAYGNKRKIYEQAVCGRFGLGGIYRLSSHIGLSMDARFIMSECSKFDVYYHDQSFVVKQRLPLHQFGISVGINDIF